MKEEKRQLYTVYDNRTDFPVCVCEPARRCAEIMGVALNTFHRLVNNGGKGFGDRWTVLKEAPWGECHE